MERKVRVAILENHQSVIDGYRYRLSGTPHIAVAGTARYGIELEPLLVHKPVDVLITAAIVPTAPGDRTPYVPSQVIPVLIERHPGLTTLVISMYDDPVLVQRAMNAGAHGYILKEDADSIARLGAILLSVAAGGTYVSPQINWSPAKSGRPDSCLPALSPAQIEALSLSAAHPEWPVASLARRRGVAASTFRNLLSQAYARLGVHKREGAVAKARRLGLIQPDSAEPLWPPAAHEESKRVGQYGKESRRRK